MKKVIKKISKIITKEKIKTASVDLIFLVIGCLSGAFATVAIMIPNGLASGGVTGIARIVQDYTGFDYSLIYYALTVVVVIVIWIMLGFKEVKKILLLSIMYPAALLLLEQFPLSLLAEKDILLASVFCGVFSGVCNGIVFYRGYSFGGTDSLAKALRKKVWPHISQNKIMTGINIIVIIACAFVFGRNIALYALITQWIATEAVNLVLYGFRSTFMQLQIITDKGDEVCHYIMQEMNRGVSIHTVTGAYTNTVRNELRLLCSPRESVQLRRHLTELDPDAFVTVVQVDNVWGKGFQAMDKEDDQ